MQKEAYTKTLVLNTISIVQETIYIYI